MFFFLQGDWKIAGLGLTIPLLAPGGAPTRWEFPTFDGHVPSYIQRSFDYMGTILVFSDACLVKYFLNSAGIRSG
jgi:SCY1-like protein 2